MAAYDGARSEIASCELGELFDPDYRKIAEALLAESNSNDEKSSLWSRVFARLEDQELQELGARLLVEDGPLADIDWKMALKQCIQKRRQSRSKELKEIAAKLATLKDGDKEYQLLLIRANELRNKKSELK